MKFYDQRRTMNGNPFNYINIIEMFGLCVRNEKYKKNKTSMKGM